MEFFLYHMYLGFQYVPNLLNYFLSMTYVHKYQKLYALMLPIIRNVY